MNKRLTAIANLIKKGAMVLDVGTDHAYLPIYLVQNKITKKVLASDISAKALEGAQKNIDKENIKDIKLICTDGLKNINEDYDALVISGMGTMSIINILKDQELPYNIILSSNNNLYDLRKFMNQIGYTISQEVIVLENNIYYDILAYEKGKEKLSITQLKYGISNNKEYYKYLLDKNRQIFKKVNLMKKIILLKELYILKRLSI